MLAETNITIKRFPISVHSLLQLPLATAVEISHDEIIIPDMLWKESLEID